MSSQTVARRYATALGDVVSKVGEERIIQNELNGWEAIISSSAELQEALGNPTVPYEQKRRLLEELIKRTKVHQITANFLRVLLKNQRITELREINDRFARVLDERAGVVAAEITTARPVSEESKQSLYEKLKAVIGQDIRLTYKTDEGVIGGIVTRIGSTVYDGSVRTQLDQIKERLTGA